MHEYKNPHTINRSFKEIIPPDPEDAKRLLEAAKNTDKVIEFISDYKNKVGAVALSAMPPEKELDKFLIAKTAKAMDDENAAAEQKTVAMAELTTAIEAPDVAEQAKFDNFAAGKPIDTPVIPEQRTA
jgi:hypothetical protein